MTSAERQVRLADGGQDIAHINLVTIDTSQLTDAEGQLALQNLVEQILDGAV